VRRARPFFDVSFGHPTVTKLCLAPSSAMVKIGLSGEASAFLNEGQSALDRLFIVLQALILLWRPMICCVSLKELL